MISTNPFMDFFKNVFGFVFVNTLQVWHGETSFVQGVIKNREPGCPLFDLLGFVCILGEVPLLEERYDRCHLAIRALDHKCGNFFDARMFLDFNC